MESSIGQICWCTEQGEGGGEGGCLYRNLYSKKIVQQQVTEDISDVVIYGL